MWFDAPVRDTHTGLVVPDAECQVLDGEQARKFVRSRYLEYKDADGEWHGDSTADLGRITRQQIFIRSAISKAVSKGLTNPVTLNQLVSAGVDNVRLDEHLDAGDLLDLGQQFASFDSKELVGYSIPSERYRTSAGADVQLPLHAAGRAHPQHLPGAAPGNDQPAVDRPHGAERQRASRARRPTPPGRFETIGFAIGEVDTYSRGAGRSHHRVLRRGGRGPAAGAWPATSPAARR